MLLVAEVVSEFTVEGALDEGFSELLKEAVLTEHVIRLPVVFCNSSSSSGRIGGIIKSPSESGWLIIATYTEFIEPPPASFPYKISFFTDSG
jgi:hypothetical protein